MNDEFINETDNYAIGTPLEIDSHSSTNPMHCNGVDIVQLSTAYLLPKQGKLTVKESIIENR